jgi:hypothetical protein
MKNRLYQIKNRQFPSILVSEDQKLYFCKRRINEPDEVHVSVTNPLLKMLPMVLIDLYTYVDGTNEVKLISYKSKNNRNDITLKFRKASHAHEFFHHVGKSLNYRSRKDKFRGSLKSWKDPNLLVVLVGIVAIFLLLISGNPADELNQQNRGRGLGTVILGLIYIIASVLTLPGALLLFLILVIFFSVRILLKYKKRTSDVYYRPKSNGN